MLFNSIEFIYLFLPITFFLYFYLNRKKFYVISKVFLIFASLFFYSWWNIYYLPLILVSIIFNFYIGNYLTSDISQFFLNKKYILTFGILGNIFLLSYFKYSDFLILNINRITKLELSSLNIALPLAISFFTFQQIAFLVDSYRRETYKTNFIDYCFFITFFPQLIAGPIVHHKEIFTQISNTLITAMNYKNIASGLFIFSIGLFKKVVLADNFSNWASEGFDETSILYFFGSWCTSLSYTFQIYFDFSGYTDMALGCALLFNFKLPINFNSPYKALDIQNFWRRWHITLSRFLREYIYIPIGGNKNGQLKTFFNLMIVFIIGGIWHGAGWTFIFWGFLHGVGIIINRLWKLIGIKIPEFLCWIITFNFINFTWIFFRAREWRDAIKVIKGMSGINGFDLPNRVIVKLSFLNDFGINFREENNRFLSDINGDINTLFWLAFGFFLVLAFKNSNEQMNLFKSTYYKLISTLFIFISSLFMINRTSEFLYFNF